MTCWLPDGEIYHLVLEDAFAFEEIVLSQGHLLFLQLRFVEHLIWLEIRQLLLSWQFVEEIQFDTKDNLAAWVGLATWLVDVPQLDLLDGTRKQEVWVALNL